MNYRAIAHYAGRVSQAEAIFMLIPFIMSLYEHEFVIACGFLLPISIISVIRVILDFVSRGNRNINAKDGLMLVAICWILLSVFGAVPFWFSGKFSSFVDCLFESVAGFTTTGASVLSSVEVLSKGLLFWRCFIQWIGGMGVLLFLLAVVPNSTGEHTINVLKAESPGPAPGKLVPNLKQSSKILYGIYIGLTFAQVILYLFGKMPLFDSLCNALATAGTGGFSTWNSSIGHYNSLYAEVITTVFMILFGVNFNIYYFLIIRNFKSILRSEEFKVYLGIIVASSALVTINLLGSMYDAFSVSLRYASFHVVSVMTSTGFTLADFNQWPEFSKTILIILMFIGACGGSTGGGLKVSRVVLLFKETKRILFRMSHPRSYEVVKMDGKVVDKTVVHGVSTYCVTFFIIFSVSLLLLSIDNHDFVTNFTTLAACMSNLGLNFGIAGEVGHYAFFSNFSKLVLSFNMFVGRLEIYPMLLLLSPRTWIKL